MTEYIEKIIEERPENDKHKYMLQTVDKVGAGA